MTITGERIAKSNTYAIREMGKTGDAGKRIAIVAQNRRKAYREKRYGSNTNQRAIMLLLTSPGAAGVRLRLPHVQARRPRRLTPLAPDPPAAGRERERREKVNRGEREIEQRRRAGEAPVSPPGKREELYLLGRSRAHSQESQAGTTGMSVRVSPAVEAFAAGDRNGRSEPAIPGERVLGVSEGQLPGMVSSKGNERK